MKTLCIILARAGSVGLPGKNTCLAHGKPLVAWTIQHAKQAQLVDHIVLSTDGRQIARVGHAYGIEVIDRPAPLAGDQATVASAALHALQTAEQQLGLTYDAIVILYGNVPLRPANLVDTAIRKLETSGAHSVQSVSPVGKTHPYWMKRLVGPQSDILEDYQPNHVHRRQDLPPVYQLDGGIIAVTRSSLLTPAPQPGQPHAFLGKDRRAIITQPGQVVDVDAAADLATAQAMLRDTNQPSPQQTPGPPAMKIGSKPIGDGHRVYIIAELGVNHDGSLDRAIALTRAAHQAGADAVKLQLFDSKLLLSEQAQLAQYQQTRATDVHEMLVGLQLNTASMLKVRQLAHELELGFIVTCFSLELVQEMRRLDVDAIKIASPDAVNLPLIESLISLNKPMLISTGACELQEIDTAVTACLARPTALLHCVSAYPVPNGHAAIGAITDLKQRYRVPVGYSDHTTSIHAGMLAVAAGATVIEKHLTYDQTAAGPDHGASFDPGQFTEYVGLIRTAELQLAHNGKQVLDCELDVRRVARQSVCVLRDLPVGHTITRDDITVKRPGTGIPACDLDRVIGQSLKRPVAANHLLCQEDLI